MTEPRNKLLCTTLLLTISAGFCDTVTFVAADNIFSAHVTGNFIVFAYQLITGSDVGAWIKLVTFPVFVLAVIVGGRMARNESQRYTLLTAEGVLLMMAGMGSYALQMASPALQNVALYGMVMLVVFAMGLQNTFSRLFAKEAYGPTTIMTGNVTQAALDLGNVFWNNNDAAKQSFSRQSITIVGFLIGCLLGAVMGSHFGLASVVLPGIVILIGSRWLNGVAP